MKASVAWLQSLCAVQATPAELAERLTNQGLETGIPEPVAAPPREIVAGRFDEVVSISRTNYRKIAVDVGRAQPLTVITAAPGVKRDRVGALALAGATLPDGRTIAAHEYSGVVSEAMLCSAAELGLGDTSDRLLELPAEIEPGLPLADLYGLPDATLEIDITANRGDCFSMVGVARELHASTGEPLNPPAIEAASPAHSEREAIEVAEPEACPRYLGRVIAGIDPSARSPLWLAERLRRAGQRPTHPVVDVLNYVMLELGQPLHAFDRERLRGGIHVRHAREGERIRLLTEARAELEPDMLVIADGNGPVAVAGIMGGAESAVSPATRDIFIESAYFSPAAVRGRARRLGLASEASLRYERGVDPDLPLAALERATRLVMEIAGGAPGPVCSAEAPDALPSRAPIDFKLDTLARLIGIELSNEEMTAIFSRLGLAPEAVEGAIRVTPPGARFDLENEADLAEELARIAGYDRIPAVAPSRGLAAPRLPHRAELFEKLTTLLCARGYDEALTLSLVDPARDAALAPGASEALRLDYPLSERESVLRRSMWPGLLAALARNVAHQAERVRLFELGAVFDARTGEHARLGAVLSGAAGPEHWDVPRREVDFYDLKGDVEALLTAGGAKSVEFSPSTRAGLAIGRAASARVAGKQLAEFGVLAPELAAHWDLPPATLLLEFDLEALARPAVVQARPVPRFPAVRRDLSLLVPGAMSGAKIEATARRHAGKRLATARIFDVYTGQGVPEGKRSIGLGLIFRDMCRTLTDAEVDAAVSAIVTGLSEEVNADVRN
jgi:phenylalanyl-tRNA synthetase beta chain